MKLDKITDIKSVYLFRSIDMLSPFIESYLALLFSVSPPLEFLCPPSVFHFNRAFPVYWPSQHLPHSPIDGRGCHARCQLFIRSNLGFSILLKDTMTCSWGSREFEPATFPLLDDLFHLLCPTTTLFCTSVHGFVPFISVVTALTANLVSLNILCYTFLCLRLISSSIKHKFSTHVSFIRDSGLTIMLAKMLERSKMLSKSSMVKHHPLQIISI